MANGVSVLQVTSHVARDLLQSAALFKTDKLVVWEYVSNGLQYVDPGVNPVVKVSLDSKRKRITITDNGRGMDWDGLQNFFVMHGENLDRKEGRAGRGLFGTGKSAAFGIADTLRLRTVRSGRLSVVQLRRPDIESMKSGDPIPVTVLEKESSTTQHNGTAVEIEDIHLKSIDQAAIIAYLERHLAHWSKSAKVFVNNHECEFAEPPVAKQWVFEPDDDETRRLGAVRLILKASMRPLEEDLRGVSIFSRGVWYETSLAGAEGREMSQYLFGEVDVPALDEDTSPIPPLDMSRSMKLNPNNELVRILYAFLFNRIEVVRKELVDADKKRRNEEEVRRLSREADEIADIINSDFREFSNRLARLKAQGGSGSDVGRSAAAGVGGDDLLFGGSLPVDRIADAGGPGASGNHGGGGEEPRLLDPIVDEGETEPAGRKTGGEVGRQRKPRGGFIVEFENLGAESHRAQYFRDRRAILINLDHPQISAARGNGNVEDISFRRLAYEVAFAEYSIALASELAAHDEYNDPTDPIFDIRDSINRLARKAAGLYES